MFKVKKSMGKDYFFGEAPSVFVGRHGWPNVNVGILSPPEEKETAKYDAPRMWANENYSVQSVVGLRGSLVNSRFKSPIQVNDGKTLAASQEVAMARKPVDVEINLERKPSFRVQFGGDIMPMGPNAGLKSVDLTENPKIPTKIDKVFSDTDLKANEAMNYLFENNFDENYLSKILSVGTLGVKKRRTLVPTRWSITAVDDGLGKNLIKEIKDFSESDYHCFFGGHLGNYYLIMMFPEIWSYELFESYLPKASWNTSSELKWVTDYEAYRGRKNYAQNTAGGYYAARLPILEKLKSMKRQSSVLALRFITDEYEVPLGVWVVREATRKAMMGKSLNFSTKELMIKYAKLIIQKKFGVDIQQILDESVMLKTLGTQSKLSSFF